MPVCTSVCCQEGKIDSRRLELIQCYKYIKNVCTRNKQDGITSSHLRACISISSAILLIRKTEVLLHTLKDTHNRFLDRRNNNTNLFTSLHQLGCIQFVITTSSSQNLGLLLQRKVLVLEGRINVLGVQIQNLIMGDYTRVGKVIHSLQIVRKMITVR